MSALNFLACSHTCKSKPCNPLGRQGGLHRALWFIVIPLFCYFTVFCINTQDAQYQYYKKGAVASDINTALYTKGNSRSYTVSLENGDKVDVGLPDFDSELAVYSCAYTGEYANVVAGRTDAENCDELTRDQGCLAGFYQPYDPTYGNDGVPKPCPKGYFCPQDHTCIMQCPLGSLCANSTMTSGGKCFFKTDETNADGKYETEFMNSKNAKTVYAKNPAKYGKYGGGNSNETVCPGPSALVPCPKGYYCPSPSQSIICPKGYYCPLGSPEPVECVLHIFDGMSCFDIGQEKPAERPLLFSFFFGTLSTYFVYKSYSVIAHEFAIRLDVVKAGVAGVAASTGDTTQDTLHGMIGIFGSQHHHLKVDQKNAHHFLGCHYHAHKHMARVSFAFFVIFLIMAIVAATAFEDATFLAAMVMCTCVSFGIVVFSSFGYHRTRTMDLEGEDKARGSITKDGWVCEVVMEADEETGKMRRRIVEYEKEENMDFTDMDESSPRVLGPSSPGTPKLAGQDSSTRDSKVLSSLTQKNPDESRGISDMRVDFEFEELGLKLKGSGFPVLKGVTGALPAGAVTAVMGPSGAGKTTFLNTLSGRATYGNPTGVLKVNGKVCDLTGGGVLDRWGSIVGFVPQEDIMHRELTVNEILRAYAYLRLPRSYSRERMDKVAADVQSILGLDFVQDSPIGDETTRGISGGQRKRVNVGMEMVSDPSVLFLDEPTSGLDSTTSYELVSALHAIARKGCNVITVLHQPSFELYQKFGKVLLLGKGGRTVFLGLHDQAKHFFNGDLHIDMPPNMNPADFFMDCIAAKYKPEDGWFRDNAEYLDKIGVQTTWSFWNDGAQNAEGTDAKSPDWMPFDAAASALLEAEWGRRQGVIDDAVAAMPPLPPPQLAAECTECGNIFKTDATFCRMCGTKRAVVNAPPTQRIPDELDLEVSTVKVEADLGSGRSSYSVKFSTDASALKTTLTMTSGTTSTPLSVRRKDRIENWGPNALFPVWRRHRDKYIQAANGDHDFWSKINESRISDEALRSKKGVAPLGAFKVFAWRAALQVDHNIPGLGLDLFLQFCAGLLLGNIYADIELSTMSMLALMYPMGLGLTTALSSLKTFGAERIVYWREAALGSGMFLNSGAYFLAKVVVDLPRLILLTICFAVSFYPQASPAQDFASFLYISLVATWSATGFSYLISVSLDNKAAQLCAVIVVLSFNMFGGTKPVLSELEDGPMFGITYISYSRWLAEQIYVGHTIKLSPVFRSYPSSFEDPYNSAMRALVVRSYSEGPVLCQAEQWQEEDWCKETPITYMWMPTVMNLWLGLVARILTYAALNACNRDKMGQLTPGVFLSEYVSYQTLNNPPPRSHSGPTT
mmetsp:Transcript_106188/g.307302  ORF Transcript_106188/g.307302 Transcript_106188/m.307302 type:complete len:1356 (-) Transcript_106188:519-4586(-)